MYGSDNIYDPSGSRRNHLTVDYVVIDQLDWLSDADRCLHSGELHKLVLVLSSRRRKNY